MRDVDLLFHCAGVAPLLRLLVKVDFVLVLLYVHQALEVSQSVVGLLFWNFSSDSTFAPDNVALTFKEKLSGFVSAIGLDALVVSY